MATKGPRISRAGVTSGGRFALYSNSPEVKDFDPALVRIIPGNSLSLLYLSNQEIQSDVISETTLEIVGVGDSEPAYPSGNNVRNSVPSISDILVMSNTVVYDAAGLPSVTLIFKIKNSSGETLRGMNAKVELI